MKLELLPRLMRGFSHPILILVTVDNFGFVWRLIPDITFDGSYVDAPSANFTVRPRQNPGANYGSSDNPAVTSTQNDASTRSYDVQQFTQQIYVRIRGRQMALKFALLHWGCNGNQVPLVLMSDRSAVDDHSQLNHTVKTVSNSRACLRLQLSTTLAFKMLQTASCVSISIR